MKQPFPIRLLALAAVMAGSIALVHISGRGHGQAPVIDTEAPDIIKPRDTACKDVYLGPSYFQKANTCLMAREARQISENEIQLSGGFEYQTQTQIIDGDSAIVNLKTQKVSSCKNIKIWPR